MANTQHAELVVKNFQAPKQLKMIAVALAAIGALGFAVALLQNAERAWAAYLTGFFFVMCLSLGGLFIVAINHIAKAGWSTSIRRLAEGMTAFIPLILVGLLVLLAGLQKLYVWAQPEMVAGSDLLQMKSAYLNVPFLVLRFVIFAVGTYLFARAIVGNSIKQDESGDHKLTEKNVALSVTYMVFFSLSFSLLTVDLLMSLLPTWYSTIYGIYCFSGMAQSSFAALLLIMIFMRRYGYIQGYYTDDHIHDIAKFVKGFTVFWAYIAFSQFMLIWYANIPEETEFFLMRAQNGWMGVSIALLVFKFIVPFLALLPRNWKRNENHLIAVCSLILVMQYVDVHWLVYPNFNDNVFVLGWVELALVAGFLGLFLITLIRFFEKNKTVAVKDPRLHEALHHHVTY